MKSLKFFHKKGNNGTKGQDLRVWDEQTDLYDEGSDEDNGLSVRLNALRTRPVHWSNSVCVCVWQQSVNRQMNFQSHDASSPPSASSPSSSSPPQLISQLLLWLQEEWRQHWFHTSALFFILWNKTCVSVSQRTSISFFYLQMQKKNSLNVSPGPVYKTKKSGTELENVLDAVQSADVISLTYVFSTLIL